MQAAEQGAAVPPVSEVDLKCLHEACVDMVKRCCGKDGMMSMELMVRACRRDANLPAVWIRHNQLRMLVRHGYLAAWQHDDMYMDDAVYRVAATIPMNGIRFDPETFVREVRKATAA